MESDCELLLTLIQEQGRPDYALVGKEIISPVNKFPSLTRILILRRFVPSSYFQ